MKKLASVLALFLVGSMLTSGCGGGEKAQTKGKSIKELKIAVAPYKDAKTVQTKIAPLGDLLKKKMQEKGYNIDKVSVNVGTSYKAVGEALSSGSADAGFISGGTYVLYDKEIDVLLTALRQTIDKTSDDLKIWNNGQPEKFTKNLTTYYRSCFLVGPSAKGKALLAKVQKGEQPTWEELNALTWSVMGPSSASGYMYPSLWLQKHYGKQITDLAHVVQADSYTTSLARLASGQADILVAYSHIRANLAEDWQKKFGRTKNIWEETGVIGITDKIYNDTVSVSKASKLMDDEKFRKAFGEALIEISKTPEGAKVLKSLGHWGYDWTESKNYDSEREVIKMLKK